MGSQLTKPSKKGLREPPSRKTALTAASSHGPGDEQSSRPRAPHPSPAPETRDAALLETIRATKTKGRVQVYLGDCRRALEIIPEAKRSEIDLIFADPPFNWARAYEEWNDKMAEEEYLRFTYEWLDLCADALTPTGSFWVNIPDTWAAEIVVHLKQRGMTMVNWCVWHYRFGQNTTGRFINSKVHALYFSKDPKERTFNAEPILEPSDRATTYFDPRTDTKKDGTPGMRLPMDVWYGKYWGRIQGNNKERRPNHDNQIPEVYLERVIRACSNEGDLVLDPFLGSGTTCTIAARAEP